MQIGNSRKLHSRERSQMQAVWKHFKKTIRSFKKTAYLEVTFPGGRYLLYKPPQSGQICIRNYVTCKTKHCTGAWRHGSVPLPMVDHTSWLLCPHGPSVFTLI